MYENINREESEYLYLITLPQEYFFFIKSVIFYFFLILIECNRKIDANRGLFCQDHKKERRDHI